MIFVFAKEPGLVAILTGFYDNTIIINIINEYSYVPILPIDLWTSEIVSALNKKLSHSY